MPTRLQIARRDIFEALDSLPQKILRLSDVRACLESNRTGWRLAQATTVQDFIRFLIGSKRLRRFEFPFAHRKETRFTWGTVPTESVLLTLREDCHFSHYSAMHMHGLTEQSPKTYYLNSEQPPKPKSSGRLLQERIDAAFKRKPRITTNVTKLGDIRVCLLNGMSTGYLGVETREIAVPGATDRTSVRVTDLERTLIDIVVRPFHSGGVHEVLKAYERAGSRASLNRIGALLKQLGFTYPYHQAIGFLAERSGAHNPEAIELFRGKFPIEFDFYLDYQMRDLVLDQRWRLYVPKRL